MQRLPPFLSLSVALFRVQKKKKLVAGTNNNIAQRTSCAPKSCSNSTKSCIFDLVPISLYDYYDTHSLSSELFCCIVCEFDLIVRLIIRDTRIRNTYVREINNMVSLTKRKRNRRRDESRRTGFSVGREEKERTSSWTKEEHRRKTIEERLKSCAEKEITREKTRRRIKEEETKDSVALECDRDVTRAFDGARVKMVTLRSFSFSSTTLSNDFM